MLGNVRRLRFAFLCQSLTLYRGLSVIVRIDDFHCLSVSRLFIHKSSSWFEGSWHLPSGRLLQDGAASSNCLGGPTCREVRRLPFTLCNSHVLSRRVTKYSEQNHGYTIVMTGPYLGLLLGRRGLLMEEMQGGARSLNLCHHWCKNSNRHLKGREKIFYSVVKAYLSWA